MSFLGLDQLQWTAIAAIAGLLLALATGVAVVASIYLAHEAEDRADKLRKTDRDRDDQLRKEDRKDDSDRRQEDREHDAELRRQEREHDDQLRREADEKWERRRRDEQRQREDNDAQQQVTIEFPSGGPLSQAQQAVITGDGVTHRVIVTTTAAYPIKGLDAQITNRTNSGLGMVPTGWTFPAPVTENGQVRYTCNAAVSQQVHDPAPIVRFTDRNGNLYYVLRGYTQRFPPGTDWTVAAAKLDLWNRTGPGSSPTAEPES